MPGPAESIKLTAKGKVNSRELDKWLKRHWDSGASGVDAIIAAGGREIDSHPGQWGPMRQFILPGNVLIREGRAAGLMRLDEESAREYITADTGVTHYEPAMKAVNDIASGKRPRTRKALQAAEAKVEKAIGKSMWTTVSKSYGADTRAANTIAEDTSPEMAAAAVRLSRMRQLDPVSSEPTRPMQSFAEIALQAKSGEPLNMRNETWVVQPAYRIDQYEHYAAGETRAKSMVTVARYIDGSTAVMPYPADGVPGVEQRAYRFDEKVPDVGDGLFRVDGPYLSRTRLAGWGSIVESQPAIQPKPAKPKGKKAEATKQPTSIKPRKGKNSPSETKGGIQVKKGKKLPQNAASETSTDVSSGRRRRKSGGGKEPKGAGKTRVNLKIE